MIAETIPYFTQLQYTQSPRNKDDRLIKDSRPQTYLDDLTTGEHDQSVAWSIGEQEHIYSNQTEQRQKTRQKKDQKQISSTPTSSYGFELKQNLEENERLKNNPNVTSLIEDIIENTLWNILQEAYHNEFSLTARPRLIALPPKRQSSLLTRTNLQQTNLNQLLNLSSPPLIMTESFD